MNAKQVLNKIIAALSADKEMQMTYAKLSDGTILESPTFDVGEMVEVVSEDGAKTAAPDGEHEIILKDSEGKDVRIKVETKDGKITERENVELKDDEEKEMKEEDKEEKMESIAGEDIGGEDEDASDLPVDKIPEDMEKKYTDLAYRIEEMEKKISKMMEEKEEDEKEKMKEEEKMKEKDEMELPKLDGAPIEENASKTQNVKMSKKDKVASSQSTFLSKLYK